MPKKSPKITSNQAYREALIAQLDQALAYQEQSAETLAKIKRLPGAMGKKWKQRMVAYWTRVNKEHTDLVDHLESILHGREN